MVYISKKARGFMRKVETTLRKGAQRPYRTPVTNNMSKIASLTRKVNQIVKTSVQRINYTQTITQTFTTVGGTPSYAAIPLTKFSNWTRIFGTDADDETGKTAVLKGITGRWQTASNEPDNRTYSIWVVSLKEEASSLLNADGTLASLVSGNHYVSDSDRTLLNLKFFNVHYHKAQGLGVVPMQKAAYGTGSGSVLNSPSVQNIPATTGSTMRFGKFSIKPNSGKGIVLKNPVQDWKVAGNPKDVAKNYFILTFWSGDSSADLEYPGFYCDTVISMDV